MTCTTIASDSFKVTQALPSALQLFARYPIVSPDVARTRTLPTLPSDRGGSAPLLGIAGIFRSGKLGGAAAGVGMPGGGVNTGPLVQMFGQGCISWLDRLTRTWRRWTPIGTIG